MSIMVLLSHYLYSETPYIIEEHNHRIVASTYMHTVNEFNTVKLEIYFFFLINRRRTDLRNGFYFTLGSYTVVMNLNALFVVLFATVGFPFFRLGFY